MHIDLTRGRPLTCSQCGSINAVNPINDPHVRVRCADCGHRVLTPEGERWERQLRGEKDFDFQSWTSGSSDDGHKF